MLNSLGVHAAVSLEARAARYEKSHLSVMTSCLAMHCAVYIHVALREHVCDKARMLGDTIREVKVIMES